MNSLYASNTGLIHLITAVFSLIAGTLVLYLPKGAKLHKQMGYAYSVCMLIMLITAFMIYRLFNGFGVFHIAAIASSFQLLVGLYVPLFMRKNKMWPYYHFRYMYWSVIGLYAAFVAETMVRIPQTPFFGMVGVAVTVVVIGGVIGFSKKQKEWKERWVKN